MLTNTQLEFFIVGCFALIILPGIFKAIWTVLKFKQPAGDDMDDGGFDINQENPWYPE